MELGTRPVDGDVSQGTAWIPDLTTGALLRVDRAGTILQRVATGLTGPFVLCVYEGAIWTGDYKGFDVVRVDPAVAAP